jgi:EmrB/QacA subfamily drug resistance transporter
MSGAKRCALRSYHHGNFQRDSFFLYPFLTFIDQICYIFNRANRPAKQGRPGQVPGFLLPIAVGLQSRLSGCGSMETLWVERISMNHLNHEQAAEERAAKERAAEEQHTGLGYRLAHVPYKWVALSNTTLGVFMAALDGSIVLISLPAIFHGIGINPLAPGETDYLLWTLMGYLVVTATLLVAFGRISDMFGRVRLYNLGFAIFAVGSVLLYLVNGTGNTAALEIIIFRLIQAVGGAFLFSNSTAIITDAFPPDQRGTAMGINQIAALAGQFIGLVLGGLLAAINWRAVFLVSVPFSVGGTIWAYLALHETARIRKNQKLDIPGNILFAVGLTVLLVGMTYGLQPYGTSSMGWTSPFVLACLIGGVLALVAFVIVEQHVEQPMFHLDLFKIRMFAAGNIAAFLASLARGGLNFMLIMWLQGIWLPLHGYSFEDTPLWAGIYMLPLTGGFLLMGPLSGHLSDRYGSRFFSTAGMLVTALGFVGLILLPINFSYPLMAVLLLLIGMGMGMFAAPNTTAIMNSVPPEHRGASSGMRATFQNTANTLSITMIFTMVTIGLAAHLPTALYQGLTRDGIPAATAQKVASLPPTGAMFAAFLGYNPMGTLLPAPVVNALSPANQAEILGKTFFPNLLAGPFKSGLVIAFVISVILSLIAALASFLRGQRVIYDVAQPGAEAHSAAQQNPGDMPRSEPEAIPMEVEERKRRR